MLKSLYSQEADSKILERYKKKLSMKRGLINGNLDLNYSGALRMSNMQQNLNYHIEKLWNKAAVADFYVEELERISNTAYKKSSEKLDDLEETVLVLGQYEYHNASVNNYMHGTQASLPVRYQIDPVTGRSLSGKEAIYDTAQNVCKSKDSALLSVSAIGIAPRLSGSLEATTERLRAILDRPSKASVDLVLEINMASPSNIDLLSFDAVYVEVLDVKDTSGVSVLKHYGRYACKHILYVEETLEKLFVHIRCSNTGNKQDRDAADPFPYSLYLNIENIGVKEKGRAQDISYTVNKLECDDLGSFEIDVVGQGNLEHYVIVESTFNGYTINSRVPVVSNADHHQSMLIKEVEPGVRLVDFPIGEFELKENLRLVDNSLISFSYDGVNYMTIEDLQLQDVTDIDKTYVKYPYASDKFYEMVFSVREDANYQRDFIRPVGVKYSYEARNEKATLWLLTILRPSLVEETHVDYVALMASHGRI